MSTLRRLTSALLFAVAVPAQALPSPGALPRPESLLADLYRAWGRPEPTAPDGR